MGIGRGAGEFMEVYGLRFESACVGLASREAQDTCLEAAYLSQPLHQQHRVTVCGHGTIAGQQGQGLIEGLGYQQPVERVGVQQGQRLHAGHV